jgi:hypothetical protein
MSIGIQAEATAITTVIQLIHGDVFHRIVDEMKRVNESHPHATGADKRAIVIADAKIIFDDLIEPVAESVIRLLIEIGMVYLKAQLLVAIA